jgi:hypothetical protein
MRTFDYIKNEKDMYVANKKFGIGQVESIDNGKVTVYFEDEDVTKVLVEMLVTIYESIEEAEIALNPEMSEEEKAEILAKIEADKVASSEAKAAMNRIEEINREASINLMKNI